MSEALLPPLILELRARAGEVSAELGKVRGEVAALDRETAGGMSKSQKAFSGLASVGKTALIGIGGAALLAGGEGLKLGIDFQEATTQLVTGAGESEAQIGKVRNGILSLAGKVGQTPIALAHGMYLVESAGYHGAAGLKVMQAAAEGAKIGAADMTVVSDGLTTAMNDYHFSADQAGTVTSKLIATVASGKTNMGDLSGALAHVLPFASALGIKFNDVMGAMATMTGEGIHAADSATYLKFGMMALANETPKGSKALLQVGLNAKKVHDSLAQRGLSGTLQMVTDAVGKKFPAGSANYTASIAAIVGGTRGMAATLALTGGHMKTYQSNIKSIAGASTEAGGHVKGWAETQKDLGTQISQAKAQVEAILTRIGMGLIPYVEKTIHVVSQAVEWFSKHTTVTKILAGVIGGILVVSIAAYIAQLVKAKVKAVIAFGEMVAGWMGLGPAAASAAAATATASDAITVAEGEVAATSEATGAATSMAFGPIGLAIAAIVLAVTLLATHWKQSWGFIKDAAHAVWTTVLRPVFSAIATAAEATMGALMDGVHAVEDAWNASWGAVKSVYDSVIAPVFRFVGEHWGLLLAGLTGGLSLLIQHWRDVWGAIKTVARVVWQDVLKPIFSAIVTYGIHPVIAGVQLYLRIWRGVFNTAVSLLRGAWTVIQNVFGWIYDKAIQPIVDAVKGLGRVWSGVWGAIKTAVQDAWNFIKPIVHAISSAVGGVVHTVGSIVKGAGSVVSDLNPFSWDTGGFVPGPAGSPVPGVVHGGEFVLSTAMLSGSQPIPGGVVAAVLGNGTHNSGTRGALAGQRFASVPGGGGQLAAGGGGGGGGGVMVAEVHSHVHIDSKELFEAVQRQALRAGMRRGVSWQNYDRG